MFARFLFSLPLLAMILSLSSSRVQGRSLLVLDRRNGPRQSSTEMLVRFQGLEGLWLRSNGKPFVHGSVPGGEAILQVLVDEFPKRERSLSLVWVSGHESPDW